MKKPQYECVSNEDGTPHEHVTRWNRKGEAKQREREEYQIETKASKQASNAVEKTTTRDNVLPTEVVVAASSSSSSVVSGGDGGHGLKIPPFHPLLLKVHALRSHSSTHQAIGAPSFWSDGFGFFQRFHAALSLFFITLWDSIRPHLSVSGEGCCRRCLGCGEGGTMAGSATAMPRLFFCAWVCAFVPLARVLGAPNGAAVESVPGFSGDLPSRHFAG